ncbi:MAG TPA: alkaline phosphatase family protein [Prolixibacteraceae bacterium]|nr:alkaline phosphatase family protein [Prolixibacteraceae bacterium]
MVRRIFPAFFLFIFPLFLFSQGHTTVSTATPRLIVGLVVENMHPDYIERYWDKFGEDGFRRLYTGGYICANHHVNNLIQRPTVGMATLYTGTSPSHHGIVNDNWIDRLRNKETDCILDNSCTTIGSDSKLGARSASKLMTPTLGDRLKLVTKGRSRIFSIAMNDYAAIFSAGHSADGAYWLDDISGNMISSSCYMDIYPLWAVDFNKFKLADKYLGSTWNTVKDQISYIESVETASLHETGFLGKYNNFPYDLNKLKKESGGNYAILKSTPFANTYLKDFALQLIPKEQLGYDFVPDLLTIVFSSMDRDGGNFGALSVEMEDTYLRMDKEIAELLKYIESGYGTENVLFFLTSTSSVSYHADYLKEKFRMNTGIFNPESSVSLLKSFLNIKYGEGDWIEKFSNQQLYLNHELAAKKKINLHDMEAEIARFLNQFEGIAYAKAAYEIESDNFLGGPLAPFQNNFHIKRSGDVMIRYEEGWLPKEKYKSVDYTDNDQVPLVWYGAGIRRGTTLKKTDATDVVPTICALLGIVPPGSSTGNVIEEILPKPAIK